MTLEILSHGRASDRPALLFVHGAFHSARCWEHHFLPWFADQGWEAHGVSLRGHGGSAGNARLDNPALEDYVDDIRTALDHIGRPAVLIGHSMGGVLVQMARARFEDVKGAVLLASSPLRPSPLILARIFWNAPLATWRYVRKGDMVAGQKAFIPFFFAPELDPALRAQYVSELSEESARAVGELFSRAAPEPEDLDTRPVLVVAGRHDWSIPMRDHKFFAGLYRAPLEVCDGAHDVMLDPRWKDAAATIDAWLLKTFAG